MNERQPINMPMGTVIEKAAQAGDVDAQYALGMFYLTGVNGKKNVKTAIYWFRKAADQNHVLAQHNLGVCLANGEKSEGVEKDEKAAVDWFREAAKKDCAPAQFNLGKHLANGIGVERDAEAAVSWFRQAEQNSRDLDALNKHGLFAIENDTSESKPTASPSSINLGPG